ncbi:MAG: glycoside hydrolase family 9 protein [Oscillospiraceae bacterium]|nr:glycoside hydrolase family 9 protein [Oscillospiraceae bacterium]MDY3064590.1 glycoside hydrolase family 9 protein [Oscillospiraceae bacterium]
MVPILTNHIGYDCGDTKNAVYQRQSNETPVSFHVICDKTGAVCFEGAPVEAGEVDNWGTGYYYTLRFDEVKTPGQYYIEVSDNKGAVVRSYPFKIGENLLETSTLSAVGYYFKAQRSTGEYEAADRNIPFMYGKREGRVDAHGGWYDATGDYGVHLSHLSHTTYFNPQQASFSAYAFFKMNDLLEEADYPYYTMLKRRLIEEGMYGADFLMRMRAPSGNFFVTKSRTMDAYGPVASMRVLGAYHRNPTGRKGGGSWGNIDEITEYDYETSFRAGGGYAIAALAYAARVTYPSDYTKEEYLQTAVRAYDYLYANNELYANDGKWNLVDEYCALDAVIEIYKTTKEIDYLRRARALAKRIIDRYIPIDDTMGYLSVNGTDRPFFHAADAGMPVVNLLNYCAVERQAEDKAAVLAVCEKLMRHELSVTNEVANPFGYARQFVQHGDGTKENQFFYPHDVETAPWWQGENARIASLAAAARSLTYYTKDAELAAALRKYADDQINWVLGLNPFDSCMLEGEGRNNIDYFFEGERRDFIQCPGGIVNGITSALHDEHGIAFHADATDEVNDNWRWAEQWIPHATWYMYALCMKKI